MSQVAFGRLAETLPFDSDGNLLGSDFDAVGSAFRFPVIQGDKFRACDDFKYGMINLRAADSDPITLPTWDHISQTALDLSIPRREWPFMKSDHKASYKNSRSTRTRPNIALGRSVLRMIPDGMGSPSGASLRSGRSSAPL